jgi:hypothetical protein
MNANERLAGKERRRRGHAMSNDEKRRITLRRSTITVAFRLTELNNETIDFVEKTIFGMLPF